MPETRTQKICLNVEKEKGNKPKKYYKTHRGAYKIQFMNTSYM